MDKAGARKLHVLYDKFDSVVFQNPFQNVHIQTEAEALISGSSDWAFIKSKHPLVSLAMASSSEDYLGSKPMAA